jgi:acylphosphatase
MQRRTCYFSGRVQGVGFRYTAQNLAIQYNVKGYIRNAPDGRVELVIEGPDGDMDGLLEDIRRKMNGFISKVAVEESPGTGQFTRFCVRH